MPSPSQSALSASVVAVSSKLPNSALEQKVFDEMAPQQKVLMGGFLDTADHDLGSVRSTPGLVALGAEEEAPTVLPAASSMQCHSHSITSALYSVVCPLGIPKASTLESKSIRYITSCYLPHSIGVVLVGVATNVPEDYEQRPPWTPPMQEALLSMVFCYSVSKCKMKLLNDEIRKILVLSYTDGVCLLQQEFKQLSQWDRLSCNDVMTCSFRVFVLPRLIESKNYALIVWQGSFQLLVVWSSLVDFFFIRQPIAFCMIRLMDVYLLSYNYYTIKRITEDHISANIGKFVVTNEFSDGHQRFEPLSIWDGNGFSPEKFRVQGNYLMINKLPSRKQGVLEDSKAAKSTMIELLWSHNRLGARKLLECGNNRPGKYIQSLSLVLEKTDSVLSKALQLMFLCTSPQIRMVVLHFNAAETAMDELQQRSNILDTQLKKE